MSGFHLIDCVCPRCMPPLPMVGDLITIEFFNEDIGETEVLGRGIVTGSGEEAGTITYELLTEPAGLA